MKKTTLSLLREALNSADPAFTLQDVRFHIRKAITLLEEKEQKKAKRKISAKEDFKKTWRIPEAKMPSAPVSQPKTLQDLSSVKTALNLLDDMIEQEKKKLFGKHEIKNDLLNG